MPHAPPACAALPSGAEFERAVRVLALRSRRDVSSAFAGGYRSAFRGGGYEFEESRPYAPGDDVRSIDWNATARTGIPYVKRFREERDQSVLLALDVSASMRFGSVGQTKAAVAAHAAALLAAAAVRAGDRVGLLCFDSALREEIPPGRGEAQLWRVLRGLIRAARAPEGGTDLLRALQQIRGLVRRRSVVVLLSDLRDAAFLAARHELVALARRHDLVAAVLHDRREDALPRVGTLRLADPEGSGRSLLLRTGSARVRERYRRACAERRSALERRLRTDGADVLWIHTHRDPLRPLARFFQGHRRGTPGARP